MTARRKVHPLIRELAEHRRTLDLTRPQAAALAGIARSTVAALETGQCSPRLAVLEDLAHALGFRVALIRIDEKQCHTCLEVKALRYFGRDSRRADGFSNHCGPCKAKGATHHPADEPGHRVRLANLTTTGRDRGRQAALRTLADAHEKRLAQFTAHREAGLTVGAAAERVGLSKRSGERYEAHRLKQHQEEVAA